MTLNEVIRRICAIEGKKKQVDIGNAREILKCLKVICSDREALHALLLYLTK